MLRKLERERREQEARRASSHPVEPKVLPEPAGSALATSAGSVVLPTPAGSAVASTVERPLEPGRRKRFPTAEETIFVLSDEEEEVVESLSAFSSSQQAWPAERGLFSVLCRKRKWLQPRPFKLIRPNSGGPLRLALSLAESTTRER
jgi:hypothetical protein